MSPLPSPLNDEQQGSRARRGVAPEMSCTSSPGFPALNTGIVPDWPAQLKRAKVRERYMQSNRTHAHRKQAREHANKC